MNLKENLELSRRSFLKRALVSSSFFVLSTVHGQVVFSKEEKRTCFGPKGISRYLQGIFKPEHLEVTDPIDLTSDAVLTPGPEFDISGIFLQQSSNSILHHQTVNYHWFDGDGKPCAIQFHNGTPSFISRFVQTEKFKDESHIFELEKKNLISDSQAYKKASQGLYGPYLLKDFRKTLSGNFHVRNASNTDFFWFKPVAQPGKLLSTRYGNTENGNINLSSNQKTESGYYLDPTTLETSEESFKDQLDGTPLRGIPAHVKYDRRKQESYFLDHHLLSKKINIGHISSDGKISQLSKTLNLGRKIFFHDWFMTEPGVIVPAVPFGPDTLKGLGKLTSHLVTSLCHGEVHGPKRTLVLNENENSNFYFIARQDHSNGLYEKGDIIRFSSPKSAFISHTINSWGR